MSSRGEKGALDIVDTFISISRGNRPALEKKIPVDAFNSLINPASLPILCFNLKKKIINVMVEKSIFFV